MKFLKLLVACTIVNLSFSGQVKAADSFNECAYITSTCALETIFPSTALIAAGIDTLLGDDDAIATPCTTVRIMEEEIQRSIQHIIIVNSRDKNKDGFNDYAMWTEPRFMSPKMNGKVSGLNATKLREKIWDQMLSPCGDNYLDYNIESFALWQQANLDNLNVKSATEDPNHILYGYPDITLLPGCSYNENTGRYNGWTYQVYNKALDPEFAEECNSKSSILLYDTENDKYDCVKKGSETSVSTDPNDRIPDWSSFMIEVNSNNGLICANADLCNFYNLSYPVNEGVSKSRYATIKCKNRIGKNECDEDGDGGYDDECTRNNIEYHYSGKCSLCLDRNECLNEEGLFDETNCNMKKQICGKYYNPHYLAHCVIDESSVGDVLYGSEAPSFLSGYCTGTVQYSGGTSFVGRIMRCVEYSLNNMMFGAKEVISNGEIEYLQCVGSSKTVDIQSECSGGMLKRFQDGVENLVLAMMALAVTFLGFLVLFGAISSFKEIYKYVIILGLVAYFAVGDAWRDGYYLALQSVGSELGAIMMKVVDYGLVEGVVDNVGNIVYDVKVDKCNYNDVSFKGPFGIEYPELRDRHYAIWDIYDCKFENFFKGGSIVPSSATTYQKILETSLYGIVSFIFPVLLGGVISLLLVYLSFKVIFYGVAAFIVLMLLLFISPLTIPLCLFKNKKAKGIFDAWLNYIIGYSLIPLLLITLISLTFLIFDYALYGSSGDVLKLNNAGYVKIKDDCVNSYLPCLYDKLSRNEYSSKINIFGAQIPTFEKDFFVHYLSGVLRLFIVFLVLIQVFSSVLSQLSQQIFGVELMGDKIMQSMQNALQTVGKYGGPVAMSVGSRAGKMAMAPGSAIYRKMRGKSGSGANYDQ